MGRSLLVALDQRTISRGLLILRLIHGLRRWWPGNLSASFPLTLGQGAVAACCFCCLECLVFYHQLQAGDFLEDIIPFAEIPANMKNVSFHCLILDTVYSGKAR